LSIALIDVVFEWVIRTRQRVWGGENSKAAAWRVAEVRGGFQREGGAEEKNRRRRVGVILRTWGAAMLRPYMIWAKG
jgi:hypothetical protein